MPDQDTAKNGSSATVATSDANVAASNAGSDSTQPANGAVVDSASAEDKDNSAASDGQDGADGADGVRQRPGRAERTIKQLSAQIKELQAQFEQQNSLQQQLQNTSVDTSKVTLPDYSQMTEITPDQLKTDIINAASQIVDIKMQTTANV